MVFAVIAAATGSLCAALLFLKCCCLSLRKSKSETSAKQQNIPLVPMAGKQEKKAKDKKSDKNMKNDDVEPEASQSKKSSRSSSWNSMSDFGEFIEDDMGATTTDKGIMDEEEPTFIVVDNMDFEDYIAKNTEYISDEM